MDLKDTITKWHTGMCMLDDEGNLDEAVAVLLSIRAPSAKIFHNIGCVKMRQGLYSEAIQFFSNAVSRDKYLALSYFQRGVCYYGTQSLESVLRSLERQQAIGATDDCQSLPATAASSGPRRKWWRTSSNKIFLAKQRQVPRKSRHSATSASLLKRVVRTSGGAEIVVPPRPNRPPPALPANPDVSTLKRNAGFQLKREKSKSAEDILDAGESDEYSLATGVTNNSQSGSRLDVKSNLASVLSSQMKSGQVQTLPGRKSAQAGMCLHGNQLALAKSHLSPPSVLWKPPKLSKAQSPGAGTAHISEAQHKQGVDEDAGKKTVRELASALSQSMVITMTKPAFDEVAKPSKPPRPPPPQRIKH
ncbi:neutrophil cytosol factor 2 [Elysia marginata]|uniref:Neutrophil cytosol factor 2 n=1 Tax=Elysia marginata TaxID=1093978 RepID=A0AAV4H884_9GAST|nr:neutrophil cytosol factor 2 [Elysia marginata]